MTLREMSEKEALLAEIMHAAKMCDPEWGEREACAPGAHRLDARYVLAALNERGWDVVHGVAEEAAA